MKRILSSVLAVVFVFALFATVTFAAEPATYTGSDLSNYRNELLNAKFGDWAWLDAYGARTYAGYDDTIWGLICDDIDKIDAIKNSKVWDGRQFNNLDAEGRAAIRLMNAHLATLTSGYIVYAGNDLKTLRNYILCSIFGGDVADYTTWTWLANYNNKVTPSGCSASGWTKVCNDIDWFDANRRTCTEAEGKAAVINLSRDLGTTLMPEAYTFMTELTSADGSLYDSAVAGRNALIASGAAYNTNAAGPAATITADPAYFAYYYNYYYDKFTLPEYQNLDHVAAYKALVDQVFNALYATEYTGKIYYGFINCSANLETAWGTARANTPVSNGWNDLRAAFVATTTFGSIANAVTNPSGFTSEGQVCNKYTSASWTAWYNALCWGDSHRNTCTDAEGKAAIDDLAVKYAALAVNPDYDPDYKVNEAYYAAYQRLTSMLGSQMLYEYYTLTYYAFFTLDWSSNATITTFLNHCLELDEVMLEDYNNNYDYTQWIANMNDVENSDLTLEAEWIAARAAAGVDEGTRYAMRTQTMDLVGDASLYTADSYAAWDSAKADQYNAWDSYPSRQKDSVAKGLVDNLKSTFVLLEVEPTANASFNYYAAQYDKLSDTSCDFATAFDALSVEGLASTFDASVKALSASFLAARKAQVFGVDFKKAVDRLALQYTGVASVTDLCTAAEVTRLANYGTAGECAAYLAQINTAVAAIDAATSEKLTAKNNVFGTSDRGTFKVNYKTAYNGYKNLVTLAENQGVAYTHYCELLDAYNAEYTSGALLDAAEYEAMRVELEHAWWAMRAAAHVGLVFQNQLAAAAAAGNAAQQSYVANFAVANYSTYTDAQIAGVWAEFNALAA